MSEREDVTNRELDKRIRDLEISVAVLNSKMRIIGILSGFTILGVITVLIAQLTGVHI